MNVGELKRMIADLPDRLPVVVPGANHTYTLASAESAKVVRAGRILMEHDPADTVSSPESVTAVLVIT